MTISVDCAPPASAPQQHKEWNEDVAIFEKQNPNITINSIYANPCEVPASFTAMLDAGNEPNVFYTYFTDRNQVLDAGQAADITPYVTTKTVPDLNDIVPTAMAAVTAGKTLYGLPTVNYTQGLIINRKLFTQAGLNPDNPPTTWAQVEQDAKAITKLGHGIYGYGDYSAGNNGGWHFSSEIDAEGGQMVNSAGTAAAFNTAQGQAVLQALHQMRFVDHSMSPTQQLAWGTLQKQMAAASSACTSPPPTTSTTSSSRRTAATSTTTAWARCPAPPAPRRARCPAATTTCSPRGTPRRRSRPASSCSTSST